MLALIARPLVDVADILTASLDAHASTSLESSPFRQSDLAVDLGLEVRHANLCELADRVEAPAVAYLGLDGIHVEIVGFAEECFEFVALIDASLGFVLDLDHLVVGAVDDDEAGDDLALGAVAPDDALVDGALVLGAVDGDSDALLGRTVDGLAGAARRVDVVAVDGLTGGGVGAHGVPHFGCCRALNIPYSQLI